MNVILRNSTRRMIDQSRVSGEAEGFIAWLRTDGYTDYVIDRHIRRLLFVLPKLSSGTAPPVLRRQRHSESLKFHGLGSRSRLILRGFPARSARLEPAHRVIQLMSRRARGFVGKARETHAISSE
jgi:hypothetical protein